jgi:glucose-1-phosphate thymidylyltransferase
MKGRFGVKAILVAGGAGSRLAPFTNYTHKTLLPLFDKPVIDYALATIRKSGIEDITIIANEKIGQIAKHVGTGNEGERIHYVIEHEPAGVANAISLARPYTEGNRILLYFSDNITTWDFYNDCEKFRDSESSPGAVLLAREVDNPHEFGVCVMDDGGKITDIVEKPENPPSNLAIGGIYLFDENFWKYLDEEYERNGDDFSISDITRRYVSEDNISIINIGDGTWVDCGTPENLLNAGILAKNGDIKT